VLPIDRECSRNYGVLELATQYSGHMSFHPSHRNGQWFMPHFPQLAHGSKPSAPSGYAGMSSAFPCMKSMTTTAMFGTWSFVQTSATAIALRNRLSLHSNGWSAKHLNVVMLEEWGMGTAIWCIHCSSWRDGCSGPRFHSASSCRLSARCLLQSCIPGRERKCFLFGECANKRAWRINCLKGG